VIARDVITSVQDEDLGAVKMQNLMFRLGASPGGIRHPGRRLGQDNDEVYSELLGLDGDKLNRLREEGVI
jgi:crotonobetainyl-CoA:carnitine CoA-transferase CaiB-like acyl-CoA transferase